MLLHIIDVCAILCILVVCKRLLRSWHKRRSLPLPPGPKGLPLIGNALDIQDPELWKTGQKWAEKYGPLVYVEAFGTPIMFVNSYGTAADLFEKRGSIYSTRPKNVMMELEGWSWAMPIMPYGDELRRSRHLIHRFFQPAAIGNYTEEQTHCMHRMLNRLLTYPDRFPELLRQAMGEIVVPLTYGFQIQEENDPYVEIAEKGLAAIAEAEQLFLVNVFHSLRYLPSWFPGARFKKIAEEGYKASLAMCNEPYEMARRKMNEGAATSSIMSKLLEARTAGDTVINDEALIRKVTGVTYGAGADTTVSAIMSFFLAMLLHPEVQQRAQNELDRVVGKDTLPSFDDRPNLPYLEAIIKETMRWQPVAPLANTHTSDEDTEYNGYFIPAGTIMFPNVWAMVNDPNEYPEPDRFIPERWLPVEGKEPTLDVRKVFFGFGRRICPGRHFADSTIFIAAASILAAFNITKAVDRNGVPITPKAEYTLQFVRHPKPFDFILTPRSEKIKAVIRQTVSAEK